MRFIALLCLLAGCTGNAVSDGTDETDTDPSPCVEEVPDDPGVVATAAGLVRGEPVGEAWQWRGVPFAEPPARWVRPEASDCWQGTQDALAWPPECLQLQFGGPDDEEGEIVGQEDCLYLNVFSPAADDQARPVMVYIHGGGNQQGSSSLEEDGTPLFAGDLLAAREDVVVVTLQYRLGALGFLTHPALDDEDGHSGNYGLLDQVRALEWVRDNIAAFGGDPSRVLLFGESGGAVDTCFLAASPLTDGLISGVLMQSGACVIRDRPTAESEGLDRMAALGCEDPADRACLEALTGQELLAQVDSPLSDGIVPQVWGGHVDEWVVPEDPLAWFEAGRQPSFPFIVGSNADETTRTVPSTVTPALVRATFQRFPEPHRSQLLGFYPPGDTNEQARRSYIEATTDAQFTCQARRIARAVGGSQEAPVYRYLFDHSLDTPAGRRLGAFHGLELLYVFGNLERTDTFNNNVSPADVAVIDLMGAHWASFARDGAPVASSGPEWPTVDQGVYVISDEPSVVPGVRDAACDVWDAIIADR